MTSSQAAASPSGSKPIRHEGRTARPRPAVTALLAVGAALVVLDAVANLAAGAQPLYVALFTAAMTGMVVAGIVVLRDPAHAGLGVVLLGVAATGSLWDASVLPGTGPLPFLTGFLYWPYATLFALLLVRWPDRRVVGRVPRALLLLLITAMPVLTAVWQLTWDRRWFGAGGADWWWPTVVPDRDLSASVYEAQQLLLGVIVIVLVGIVVRRLAAARGGRRAALLPVVVAAVVLGAAVLIGVVQAFTPEAPIDVALVQNAAVLLVPVGVLVATRFDRDGASAVPGAATTPFDEFRDRYRLGIAGAAAVVIVTAVVIVVGSRGVDLDTVPAPAPGPAVAPGP